MLDRLTLHIGTPKTGTSSIQATLRLGAATLLRHGLYYFAGYRNNHPLARVFSADPRPGDSAVYARFRREVERTAVRHAVVSSEVFTRFTDAEVAAVVAGVKPLAKAVDVVLYVRHPVGFASSAAHQGVRAGNTLAEIAATPRILPLRAIAERWARVGPLTVRPFAREKMVGGDVVDDLLHTLGHGEAAAGLERVFVNEGLSALGAALLERALGQVPGRKLAKAAMRPFDAVGGPRYVLPAATLAEVRRRSAADLDWLARSHGVELPEPADVPTPPPALAEAELDSLATTLLALARHVARTDASALGPLVGRSPFWREGDAEASGVVAAVARRLARENGAAAGGGGPKRR